MAPKVVIYANKSKCHRQNTELTKKIKTESTRFFYYSEIPVVLLGRSATLQREGPSLFVFCPKIAAK